MAKDLRDSKTRFFTTLGVVAHLASFEELDAEIRKGEVAFGPLRWPDKKGDCFLLLTPLEVSWASKEVAENIELYTVTITACTGIISCHPNTFMFISPLHPHDFTNCKRWPHLPFYNDWHLYIRWKCEVLLKEKSGAFSLWRQTCRGNKEDVLGGGRAARCC